MKLKIFLIIFYLSYSSLFSKVFSDKDVFRSQIKLASFLKEYEYYGKSLNNYKELTKINHSVSLYIDLGVLYKITGKTKEAENIIIEAIKEKPNNTELINALGDIYFENENYNDARKYLIKIKNNNKKAINRLALIENRTNNYEEAIKYYKILINQHNEKFQRINLAILYQKLNKNELAEQELLTFYEESKDKYYARKYLIRFYIEHKEKEKLENFIKKLKLKKKKKKKMRPLLKSRW